VRRGASADEAQRQQIKPHGESPAARHAHRLHRLFFAHPRHPSTADHPASQTMAAMSEEPMEDEYATAGPLPISRLEVNTTVICPLTVRAMGSQRATSKSSSKLAIILSKPSPTRLLSISLPLTSSPKRQIQLIKGISEAKAEKMIIEGIPRHKHC
jgi:hypothetical protein